MQPIRFEQSHFIPATAADICAEIADTDRWSEFGGYAVLPGIADANYELRTDNMIGSRIRVRNTDGSEHIEEICEWDVGKKVVLKLHTFSPPLSRLATHFLEEWGFEPQDNGTFVTRKFELFPSQPAARPFLWLISLFFSRAIARHLAEIGRGAKKEK